MCVGYKRSQLENWLADGSSWGFNVTYSVEETLLGTAGALKLAESLITAESFFVLNADSFLAVDLAEMYLYHTAHQKVATMAVVRQPDSTRYGTVELAPDGTIITFREKASDCPASANVEQLINGGVYIFRKRILESIQPGIAVSLEKEIFPALVAGGLCAFTTEGFFIDIGVPVDFERAQTELPKRFHI